MIYPLIGMLIGAVFGASRAKARGGKWADLVQWGAAFGVMFGIIGLFVLVFLVRSAT